MIKKISAWRALINKYKEKNEGIFYLYIPTKYLVS